ncbi:energy transducer TonB [Microbulbifer hainanensis]|uniref:energy transducer TonB n=1 Tax=Microbulbifer hainanensis TaxID=2735675 RepID=UPI001866A87E|nr:energy transducer TonB [Microbulbifer hainanensis]
MDKAYTLDSNPVFDYLSAFVNRSMQFARSIGLAALITLLLVLAMSQLIATNYQEPNIDEGITVKDVVLPDLKPTNPLTNEAPPKPLDPPPQPPTTTFETDVDPVTIPTRMAPPGPQKNKLGANIVTRDPVPVFKPAPRYPRVALQRGIEGYVVVEFSISKTGSVLHPRVVAGYDSAGNATGLFDRAALAAVARFKYQPPLDEGRPVERHGVRNRISFKIAD